MAVVTYGNPRRLDRLLTNMKWSGMPDCRLYVFEDRSSELIHNGYLEVARRHKVDFVRTPEWGCMQGVTEYAMRHTAEDWIIWIPDDVLFTPGALWNEYAGVLAYGREYVGGIQMPYWNADEVITGKKELWESQWQPGEDIPNNPHWDAYGMPRCYVNLNGAGFAINRSLWWKFGGFPQNTWRLDEFAGFMAWRLGYICITLPGRPRIHYFGGTTGISPTNHNFHSQEEFEKAIGCSLEEANRIARGQMAKIPYTRPDTSWDDVVRYFNSGKQLV